MPRPLVPDPIRVQSCVCCLFWTNKNSMAATSIFLSILIIQLEIWILQSALSVNGNIYFYWNYSCLATLGWRLSSILWNRYLRIQIELYPDWYWLVYYCGTLSSRLSCILWNRYLRIQIESYLDWYWLAYYCGTLSSRLSCIWYLRILIELYPDWYWLVY